MKQIQILFFLIIFSSCSSSSKNKAQKLTEQGFCDEALNHWISATKEDPDDIDTQIGLRTCKEKIINDNLVKIRDYRLANNPEAAILELFKLNDILGSWNLQLDYNSSSFQGKEVSNVWFYFKSKMENLLKENKILKAELEIKKHLSLFASNPEFNELKKTIKNEGIKKCESLMEQSKSKAFFNQFAKQFCHYFDNSKEIFQNEIINSDLYGTASIQTQGIDGINSHMNASLLNNALKGFSSSAWYNASYPQNKVNIVINGEYTTSVNSDNLSLIHEYDVSIPYTVTVPVTKFRQVPYNTTRNVCTNVYGRSSCYPQTTTMYMSQSYIENVQEQRYRNEVHTYRYGATRKKQNISLRLSGFIQIDKESIPFSVIKNIQEEKIMQNQNKPDIGLYPRTDDVSNPEIIFDNLIQGELVLAIQNELNHFWSKKFCSYIVNLDLATLGDRVIKCRKSPVYDKKFVNDWFSNNFGVTDTEAISLIGNF